MPEPTTDGGNIDARINAPGCKQVAQIVVGDPHLSAALAARGFGGAACLVKK